jgi:hypothetical protein
MISNQFKRTFGGLILGFSLLLGIGIMSSTTVQAQYRRDDRYEEERYRQEQIRRDQQRNRRDDWWNRNNRRGRDRDGYGNYGGSFDLRQTALNAGFADGAKEGRKDRRDGDRYDFRDEREYQKASRDYSSRLGDRWIYQRYYREAFEHGYADGYAGY